MGLHAYRLAIAAQDPVQAADGRRREGSGSRARRVFVPAALIFCAAGLAMQAVSAAVQAVAERNRAPVRAFQQGPEVDLEDDGLTFTLPTAQWRFEPSTSANTLGELVSPRARLLLLRARAGALGVDGFMVDLAGQIAARHGPVRLTDQRTLALGARELSYQWTEDGLLNWSHLILVPHGESVHALLVAFPPRLDGRLRDEVESLVGSFRFRD
jgi:hypothetical protein